MTTKPQSTTVRFVLRVPRVAMDEMRRLAKREYLPNAQAWAIRELARAVAAAREKLP